MPEMSDQPPAVDASGPPDHPNWPIRGRHLRLFAVAYLAMVVVGLSVGGAIRSSLEQGTSSLARFDLSVSEWFLVRRTPALTSLSGIPSWYADTIQAIMLLIILSSVVYLWVRRWREPVAMVTGMGLEALVFLTVSLIVREARPPVPGLDAAPPTGSFPSGHVGGACALYVGLALAVHSATDQRWLRALAWTAAVLLPLAVAVSRLYRGMHYFTDVTVGAILGTLCALIAWNIVSYGRLWPHQPDT